MKTKNKANEVQRLVYRMLTEGTGVHMCDSGRTSNRGWQRNQKKTINDFISEDEETYQFDMKYAEIHRTVSVFHYLSGLEIDEVCEKFNRRQGADWDGSFGLLEDTYGVSDRASTWLQDNYDIELEFTFNTYNSDSDLSQILQGSRLKIFNDGQDETYYLIQIHNGADARGGYTDAKLFKTAYYSEGIHEYLWEYKHSSETEDDLREGYIESMTDYYDESIVYDNETILKRLNGGKYNTVEKVIAKLGRRPSEQELATFINNNYYDVTEVERGEDDPSSNDKIADLVAFYKFDIYDWEIAWFDAQNESVITEDLQIK